jgi:hypothetical protein
MPTRRRSSPNDPGQQSSRPSDGTAAAALIEGLQTQNAGEVSAAAEQLAANSADVGGNNLKADGGTYADVVAAAQATAVTPNPLPPAPGPVAGDDPPPPDGGHGGHHHGGHHHALPSSGSGAAPEIARLGDIINNGGQRVTDAGPAGGVAADPVFAADPALSHDHFGHADVGAAHAAHFAHLWG